MATVIPIARLATELRVTGVGQLLIGLAGLVAALALGASPARALVPFAVALVAVGGVSALSSRWLRAIEEAPPAPGAAVEPAGQTVRRLSVALALPGVALVAAAVLGAGLAAVLGGMIAGVGAVDLWNRSAVRRRERATAQAVYRQLGRSPFSGGRRPLYTRPLNESTLAT